MRVTMENATMDHAIDIAARARREDIVELWSIGRIDPLMAMRKGMTNSTGRALTGMVDGLPVCMWGVADGSLLGNTGVPWMIGSRELDQHAITFLRHCAHELSRLSEGYGMLVNWVDARNTKAIKWLEWLGFTIEKPEERGPDKALFHQFWMRVSHV